MAGSVRLKGVVVRIGNGYNSPVYGSRPNLKYDKVRVPGGARKGAGRKPDEFKRLCALHVGSPEWWKFVSDVFAGKPVEPHWTTEGVKRAEAGVQARVYLWEKLAAYAFGRPTPTVIMPGGIKINFIEFVRKTETERTLPALNVVEVENEYQNQKPE